MKKSAKGAAVFAALAVMGAGGPGFAQAANTFPFGGPVLSLVGATEVAEMMEEIGVATRFIPGEDGGESVLIAETPGGARFAFRFFGCERPAEAARCHNVIVTTAMSSAGATYADLNTFNGQAVVTTAVNAPAERIIIFGRNIIVVGGHSSDLFKATVYLFLTDVESFVNGQYRAAQVAFRQGPEHDDKLSSLSQAAPAPGAAFGLGDFSHDVASAIANGGGVDFSVNYTLAP